MIINSFFIHSQFYLLEMWAVCLLPNIFLKNSKKVVMRSHSFGANQGIGRITWEFSYGRWLVSLPYPCSWYVCSNVYAFLATLLLNFRTCFLVITVCYGRFMILTDKNSAAHFYLLSMSCHPNCNLSTCFAAVHPLTLFARHFVT